MYSLNILCFDLYIQWLCCVPTVVIFFFSVCDNVLEVEYPLIEARLEKIDERMEKALTELNWTNNGWCSSICICMFIVINSSMVIAINKIVCM